MKRVELLAKNAPLSNGEAFEITDEGKIWRPQWDANIDDVVNALYITEVVWCAWETEMVLELTFLSLYTR
jgi:hypothetical protein